jgi:4-hydroxy-tetrahydrodipicolinate synthase
MKNNGFVHGVIPPMITPTDAKGNVLESNLRGLLDHVIGGGVHGVFVLGGAGEFYALDAAQKRRVVEITMDHVAGRVPVYVGASAITTREAIAHAQIAESLGAQALSVLTPFYISPSETELYNHYVAVAKSTKLPIVLYTNPDRTGGVNISANLCERLADVENIVAIKDSSGDMTLTSEFIRRGGPKGMKVLAGRDTLIYGTLAHGGAGCVATTANIAPKLVVEIYEKYKAGDVQGALAAQYRLNPLRLNFGLGTFPAMAKDALNLIGVPAGDPIEPVVHCSAENTEKLKNVLRQLQLLD